MTCEFKLHGMKFEVYTYCVSHFEKYTDMVDAYDYNKLSLPDHRMGHTFRASQWE